MNARDDHQDTPLCDIPWLCKPEAVAALIEVGADVNARGRNSYTPLHAAVGIRRVEIVRLLLAAGADPTIPDVFGKTALDVARENNPEIANLIEKDMQAEQPPADK